MNRSFSKMLYILPAVFLMACGGNKEGGETDAPKEEVLLRFQPKVGNSYTTLTTLKVDGSSAGVNTEMNIETQMEVLGVNGKEIEMNAQYTHMDMTMDMLGRHMSFNSDTDTVFEEGDMMGQAYRPLLAMIKKKVGMVVNDLMGTVKEPDFESLLPEDLKESADLGNTSQGFDQLFVVWPEKKVTVGDSWDRDIKAKGKTPMNIKAGYKVKEITAESVILEISGEIKGEGSNAGLSFKIKGDMSGDMTIRRSDGWPVESNITQDYAIETMGQKMSMKNYITVTTK